jgi:hypothetical protein
VKEKRFKENERMRLRSKRKLQASCKRSRVRTYACEEDGYRTVKYFNYEYNFDLAACEEKILTKEMKCDNSVAINSPNSVSKGISSSKKIKKN